MLLLSFVLSFEKASESWWRLMSHSTSKQQQQKWKKCTRSAAKLKADLQRVVKVTITTVSHSSHQSHHHWRSLEMSMTVLSLGSSSFESSDGSNGWSTIHKLWWSVDRGKWGLWVVVEYFSPSLHNVGVPFHAVELLVRIPFSNPCPVQGAPSCLMWCGISSDYLEIVFKAQCHMMPSFVISFRLRIWILLSNRQCLWAVYCKKT